MEPIDPYKPPAANVELVDPRGRRLASRPARLAAEVLNLVFVALAVAPLLIAGALGRPADDPLVTIALWVTVLLLVVLASIQFAMLRRNRWSLGKRMLSIRIVRSDYTEISLARVLWLRLALPTFINFATFAVCVCVPIFAIVDGLCIFGEQRRCLHDLMADTIVVEA